MRQSHWQLLWLRAAVRWTLQLLAVPRLQLLLELRVPQVVAVITQNRCRSGTGWYTLRLCPTSVLEDACMVNNEEGAMPEAEY